jgi:hypothetical protein
MAAPLSRSISTTTSASASTTASTMSAPVAPPQNLQPQSPLIQLPAEIKHLIFASCFASGTTFVDPAVPSTSSNAPTYTHGGLALLLTCRRLYCEIDRRPLFSNNKFSFSSVDRLHSFLHSLDIVPKTCITDLEIDVRNVHPTHPARARDWVHYLSWANDTWAESLGSLRVDAPGLSCLRFNFESWPTIALSRVELWNLLRNMLAKVEGLEHVIVTGASKGSGMAKRAPFSPLHYVGGDDVGFDDLVPRMWSTVDAADNSKIVRWTRNDGKLQLEVVSKAHLLQHVDAAWTGPSIRKTHTDPWPENGSCTWFGYENRDSDVTEPTTKGLNPSAAE